MDITTSFGQQLLETLSQGSGGSSRNESLSMLSQQSSRAEGAQNGKESYPQQQQQQQQHKNRNNGRSLASGGASQASTAALSHVDEAYRRLGHRLSLQAHGDTMSANAKPPPVIRIQAHGSSGFASYQKSKESKHGMVINQEERGEESPLEGNISTAEASCSNGGNVVAARISKVPKTNYADHGEHGLSSQQKPSAGRVRSNSLLKTLTYLGKDQFRKWQDADPPPPPHPKSGAASSPAKSFSTYSGMDASSRNNSDVGQPSISPQHNNNDAFSQLGLGGNHQKGGGDAAAAAGGRQAPAAEEEEEEYIGELSNSWRHQRHHHGAPQPHHHGMGPPPNKGLLSAVLEGHSDCAERSVQTSPSISTKDSRTAGSSSIKDANTGAACSVSSKQQTPILPQHHQPGVRGKCLTTPEDGVTNDGSDNAEGNLIVYENDVMTVPGKSLHNVSEQSGKNRSSEFRILSLLGQGTFAQVFKCLHVPSGNVVAVKVVKNKPAYTRQAAVEIDVFRALQDGGGVTRDPNSRSSTPTAQAPKLSDASCPDYMVNLICFFMHRSHLCLVFELLGLNLYEVLKKRQFRGLPLSVVQSIISQAVVGVKDLSHKSIVHCDLKPENVLLVSDDVVQDIVNVGESRRLSESGEKMTPETTDSACSDSTGVGTIQTTSTVETKKPGPTGQRGKVKLIDFGSACFEGYTAHTYIQSRFYRSPEVLIGLPYDSAIDMWSLGCVAAELFLGLPILPGVHEHDQLGRITEMVGKVPDWMLDQGSKSTKYYLKYVSRQPAATPNDIMPPTSTSPMRTTPSPAINSGSPSPAPHALPQWRLKTKKEYIVCLSQNEIRKKGGLAKLEKQPGNRYFKRERLADILALHAQSAPTEDKELLPAFVHFLYGLLDLDPWKRWTAFQAIQHPFLTGDLNQLRTKTPDMVLDPKEENQANLELGLSWQAPWDPAVCRRKLLNVQKMREKQQAMRRHSSNRPSIQGIHGGSLGHTNLLGQQTGTPMNESPVPNRLKPGGRFSPPKQVTSSPSTAASNLSSTPVPPFRRTTSDQEYWGPSVGNASVSSLSSLGHPGAHVALAHNNGMAAGQPIPGPQPPPVSAAPRSYTGIGVGVAGASNILQNEDFANALQRPGVVPGLGTVVDTAPNSGPWSRTPLSQTSQGKDFSEGHQIGRSMPQSVGTPSTQPLTQTSLSNGIAASHNYHYSIGTQAFNQPFEPMQAPNLPLNGTSVGGMPSSASSSITMTDINGAPIINRHTGLPYTDTSQGSFQPQPQPLQSQHLRVMQQQHQQQQQQMTMQPPGQQFQLAPPGQQQQQAAYLHQSQTQQQLQVQQQPVYLAGGAGGGYYYMTTSAMGQPIVLQPVAVLNQQQSNQQFGQQQQQQFNHDSMPNYQASQQHGQPQQTYAHMQQQPITNSSVQHSSQFGVHYNIAQQQQQQQPIRQQPHHGQRSSPQAKPRHFRGGTSM